MRWKLFAENGGLIICKLYSCSDDFRVYGGENYVINYILLR